MYGDGNFARREVGGEGIYASQEANIEEVTAQKQSQ